MLKLTVGIAVVAAAMQIVVVVAKLCSVAAALPAVVMAARTAVVIGWHHLLSHLLHHSLLLVTREVPSQSLVTGVAVAPVAARDLDCKRHRRPMRHFWDNFHKIPGRLRIVASAWLLVVAVVVFVVGTKQDPQRHRFLHSLQGCPRVRQWMWEVSVWARVAGVVLVRAVPSEDTQI